MDANFKAIKSPLQMTGFYLAWIETALAASFWPLKDNQLLLQILLFAVVAIALIFAVTMVFILIHLVRKEPYWLFNPSDYDPSVQDALFEHDHSVSLVENSKSNDTSRKSVTCRGNFDTASKKEVAATSGGDQNGSS